MNTIYKFGQVHLDLEQSYVRKTFFKPRLKRYLYSGLLYNRYDDDRHRYIKDFDGKLVTPLFIYVDKLFFVHDFNILAIDTKYLQDNLKNTLDNHVKATYSEQTSYEKMLWEYLIQNEVKTYTSINNINCYDWFDGTCLVRGNLRKDVLFHPINLMEYKNKFVKINYVDNRNCVEYDDFIYTIVDDTLKYYKRLHRETVFDETKKQINYWEK